MTAFNQSGCALGDVSCQCTSQAFRPVFNSCQAASCGVLELQSMSLAQVLGIHFKKLQGCFLLPIKDAKQSVSISRLRLSVSNRMLRTRYLLLLMLYQRRQIWLMLLMILRNSHSVQYGFHDPLSVCGLEIDTAQQKCIYEAASRARCNIHNLTCICTNAVFSAYVGTCETIACTADELQGTLFLGISIGINPSQPPPSYRITTLNGI